MRWLLLVLMMPTSAFAVDAGDVILNELMIDAGSAPQWVELRSRADEPVDLVDCQLETDSVTAPFRDFTLDEGQFAVITRGLESCARVDEDGGCLEPSAAVWPEDRNLLRAGVAEELRLVCGGDVVDRVPVDWSLHADRCYGRQLCSVAVEPGAGNATDNDDFAGKWCIPAPADSVLTAVSVAGDPLELVGSPGLPNGACAPTTCAPGDALFTELMIDPPSSWLREYVELTVRSDDGCDLHACELREGPFDNPFFSPLDDDWDVFYLYGTGNTLDVAQGEYLVLGNPEEDLLGGPVDLTGPGVSLTNGDSAWIHLVCGATVVDSAPYDWGEFEVGCAFDGCAVNLAAAREDFSEEGLDGNDTLESWCLPGVGDTHEYVDDEGESFRWSGTPGGPGRCEVRDWPGEGELVFTELLMSPQNGDITDFPEFFEVHNVTDREIDVIGCEFERVRALEDGTESVVSYVLPADGPEVRIEAGLVEVFTKTRCIDGEEAEGGECPDGETPVGSLSFTEEPETFTMRCPTADGGRVVVDTFAYDAVRTSIRSGRAIVYDGGTAEGNDEPSAWCEAASDECYAEDDRGRCNYGTPGKLGECRTGATDVDPSGPGIRCSASGGGGGFGLLLLAAAWRRRR